MKKLFSTLLYSLLVSTVFLIPVARTNEAIKANNVEIQNTYSDAIDMWYVSEKIPNYVDETLDVEITFYLVEDTNEAIYYTYDHSSEDWWYPTPNPAERQITQYSSGLEAGVYTFWIYDISMPYDSLYTSYNTYYLYIDLWVGDQLVPHYGYSVSVSQRDDANKQIQYEMSLAHSSFDLRGWSASSYNDYFMVEMAALGDYGNYNSPTGGYTHVIYDQYEPTYGRTIQQYSGFPSNGTYSTMQLTYRSSGQSGDQIIYGEQSFMDFNLGWTDPNSEFGTSYAIGNHMLAFNYTNEVNQLAIDNVRVVQTDSDSIQITYDQNFESEDVWIYVGTDNTPSNAEWDLVTSSGTNYQGINNGAVNNKTYNVNGLVTNQTYYVMFAYGGKDSNFNGNEIVQMSQETIFISNLNATTSITTSNASDITTTSAVINYTFNLGTDWTTGWTVEYILYKDSISVSNKVKEEDITPSNLYNKNQSFEITGLEVDSNYILEFYINGTKVTGQDVTFSTLAETEIIGKPNEEAQEPQQSGETLYMTYYLAEDVTTLEYSILETGTTPTWISVTNNYYKTAGAHTVQIELTGLTVGQTYELVTRVDSVEQESTYSFVMQDPTETTPPDGGQGGSSEVSGGNLMLILGITLGAVAGIIVLGGIGYFVFNRKKK